MIKNSLFTMGANKGFFVETVCAKGTVTNFVAIVDGVLLVTAGADKGFRHYTEAIKQICTAYLKLLFPNTQQPGDISSSDFNTYCLKPAIEMRSIIKIQLSILDPDEFGGKTVPPLTVKDIDQ